MNATGHRFDTLDSAEGADASGNRPAERLAWIDRFSLNAKLRTAMLGNVVALGGLALIILGCWLFFLNWGETVGDMVSAEIRSGQATLDLHDAQAALEGSGGGINEAQRQVAIAALAEAKAEMAIAQERIDQEMPGDSRERLDRFAREITGFENQLAAMTAASTNAEIVSLQADIGAVESDLRGYVDRMRGYVSKSSDEFFGSLVWALCAAAALLLISFVLTFIGVTTIIRNVVGVVRSMTTEMNKVANGNTNVDIPGRLREDEIGEMARALEVFRVKSLELQALNDARTKEAEQRLAQQELLNERAAALRSETSDLLEGWADQFEATGGALVASVSSAIEQLNQTSGAMETLSRDSAEQSRGASEAMQSANVNVTAAAAATDEFALSINEISQQASGSAALAREASSLVDAANSQMNTLANAADEIGEIVELIQTIAQRTNLLALNASIEAARGGEAGRGFAVVAREVKELANQTSAATQSVGERIHAIQSSTNSSVDALTSIVTQIAELEQSSGVIASAVDQQSMSGEELARNIDVAASGSTNVVQRLEKLRAASEQTGSVISEVVASANELGRVAETMRVRAGTFIDQVRQSARDLAADEASEAA